MKHYLHNSLRALFLSLAVFLSLPMLAEKVEISGINYDLVAETKQAIVIAKSSGEYSGEVVIPESVEHEGTAYSVTSIGSHAFYYCDGLTSVTIGNSVTSIGSSAFSDCKGLTSVTIGNSVTSIGYHAFWDCCGLTSVTIGNSVKSIGGYAFSGCSGLTSVHISDIAAWCNIDFADDNSNPLSFAQHLYLNGEEVKDLVIPNSVTSIGDDAFRGCLFLTSVTIGNSVKSIGHEAFYNCRSLTSVHISDIAAWCNIIFEQEEGLVGTQNPLYYAHHLYLNGEEVKDLVIPNSVTSIGDYAFERCSGLTSVTIDNSVTSIGEYAFNGCSGLTSVTIPNSVTSIGDDAFSDCSGLTSVTIGNSVTSIGSRAFSHCSGLTSVTIPNSVTSIKDYAFRGCIGLTSVTIGNSVTSIGGHAFYDCSGLTSVTIPNSVTSIGWYAFSGCSGLTSVTIGNSVTSIGGSAFSGCSGLTSVTIGNSVTSIGNKALSGCSNLSCITCLNPFPPACEESTFYNVLTSKCKLLVPIGSESAYSAANGWKEFSEILGIETEVDPDPEIYNTFVMNDTTVMAGSAFTMPVELKNSCEVTAFQCDIYLPEGISLQKNNKDKYEISLDENRKDDHTITVAEQPDGSIRIVVASLSSSTFSGTEGKLLNMALLAAEDTSGEKNIAIKNVYISEANGKRHDLADAEATVTIQTYTPADVNNDGMIAIDDVVLTINTVLGNVPENFVFDAADMNGDGRILIDDVVRIINVVLGIYAPPVSNVRRNDVNERFILNQKETGVGISVSNAAGYTAMQYDMYLPEGAEVSDVRFTGKSNHKVTFRKINENVVRVVVVSLTNEAFSGNELLDVVIESALDTEISIKDANVATRGGIKGNVQDASINIGGNTTAIDQLLDGMARADVHDLNGRLVKKNASTITDLQKGIYIINGKRIIR